jgi:lysyl-tRNA synthetase class 2
MKDWKPSATVDCLKQRAQLIDKIRNFFKARDVIEVETPLLCSSTATDPFIHSFETSLIEPGSNQGKKLYLQTSPEFLMKRLLAAGMGSIYQICKAFRNEEFGRLHNPEFTILEWYRLNFDHHQLMNEVDCFLQEILSTARAQRMSYDQLFLESLQIRPHTASITELRECGANHGLTIQDAESADLTRDDWLQLLMTHFIEPHLGFEAPVFIYDFPESQAALAKIRHENPPVAERFEVYIKGLEIANGYHELCEPQEQQSRFEADNRKRQQLGHSQIPIDHQLIAALQHGLPTCAGIALGIDRLIMLALERSHIEDVIAFSVERT